MQRCPKCNQIYHDDDLNFCLEDGQLLVSAQDPEETVIRPSPFLPQSSPSVRQGFNPIFAYVVIGLLALFAGGAIMIWLKFDSSIIPTAKDQTPTNSSNSTPSVQKDDDKKLLQGLWQVQYVIDYSGMNSLPAEAKYQFLFKEDKLIIKAFSAYDSTEECDYKIDSTKSPKHLDIRRPSQSKPVLAIYEINNDELKVCLKGGPILHRPPKDLEMERPKNFDAESNSDLVVYVFKRVK